VPDLWLTGNHTVGKISAVVQQSGPTQPNSAFHPSRVGKWVVINVFTELRRCRPLKQQTRATYGCVLGRTSALSLSLSDAAVCSLRHHISAMPLPLLPLAYNNRGGEPDHIWKTSPSPSTCSEENHSLQLQGLLNLKLWGCINVCLAAELKGCPEGLKASSHMQHLICSIPKNK